MKNSYCTLPRRGRAEVIVSVLLALGINMALLVPGARSNQSFSPPVNSPFTLVENDFASPLFSSARDIRILNGAAKQIARFAGYEDFYTRLQFDSSVSVVNVTRFCGDLLSILEIDFAVRGSGQQNEACIYISERLWDFAFNRKSDIVGTAVQLHQTVYRVAGVTRSFSGLLAATDVWIPINSRSALASENSMRILGSLRAGANWKRAQSELTALFKFCSGDIASVAEGGARLLPVNQRIPFQQEIASIAMVNDREPMHGPALVHQAAAFPFKRGS